jgi:pSer/pThr/pTyr-binding forkhead associated (FHA) protein
MADNEMNSVHLEWPRREAFRQARGVLQQACGQYTQMGYRPPDPVAQPAEGQTAAVEAGPHLPAGLDYGLIDHDSIYPLKLGVNTVGRMRDNDVVIEDPHVSRRHCAIVVHATSGIELHELASKNGTYLNGERLAGPTPLHSGDLIRMCNRQFIFVTQGAQRPPAPEPTIA